MLKDSGFIIIKLRKISFRIKSLKIPIINSILKLEVYNIKDINQFDYEHIKENNYYLHILLVANYTIL